MLKRIYFFILMLIGAIPALAFTSSETDTDLIMLKKGDYHFKAEMVDTTGKYYVYKVYRGERLLRCIKKSEVSKIIYNYVTPPPEVKIDPKPVVVQKKSFNPYTIPLNIRKGFEVIDTIRILYDQDLSHYKSNENAVNIFSSAPDGMGPTANQTQLDSAEFKPIKFREKPNGGYAILFNSGALYNGEVVNKVMQGYGYYSDEIIDYKGMFANNMLNGLGILYYFGSDELFKDVVFKGNFKDGKLWDGEVYYYSKTDDKRYVKQFKAGSPSPAKLFEE